MMYNCNNHKTIFSHNKGVPVANSIHHSNSIYNYFKSLKLGLFLSDVYLNHLMIIMVSVFLRGYRGKTIDFVEVSCMHRTTTAYFLNILPIKFVLFCRRTRLRHYTLKRAGLLQPC